MSNKYHYKQEIGAAKKGDRNLIYEPKITKSAQGHFICLACGEVKEFSNEKIQGFINEIGKENNFKTDIFSFQVFGYCKNCQKR